ncbi:hypothetical protein SARC_10231 [Sphaeroforma arctica JP610]|uniref:Endonuclease V n=1 Tax=Sphaeroforma arctica JP610 TaxID=667725 RepID=A0A0L0FMQ0_9EUKA|nr:hypothetical protein SARC_10231 [Sphaeroforma arctica JP610]KNC77308.1 hypothetical protein SARC_10231 [Sphaeroforma arctica JP610]|eukprot:XP_014151210.1 hypothetical protein SARC_10231 [Sphaeroforma arctica JP610]
MCDLADADVATEETALKVEALTLIGGVDISFIKGNDTLACACLVVLSYPSLQTVYAECTMVHISEPYIAGFLAFREVSHLVDMVNVLKTTRPDLVPQVIMVDGNGLLHHQGFGLASHLSVLISIPTVGVGKTLLMVDGLSKDVITLAERIPLGGGGEMLELRGNSGTLWGMGVCMNAKVTSPIYVSVGSGISLLSAVALVRRCGQFRVPEPVRQADLRSRHYLRMNGYA